MNIGQEGKLLYTFVKLIVEMKCSELLRLIKADGWYVVSQKGSHMKLLHPTKTGWIIFPYHGSAEMAKGLEMKIKRLAGL